MHLHVKYLPTQSVKSNERETDRLYNLFHILMVKTNYEEFSNLKRIEKKTRKSSFKPIISFDPADMK